jgi:TPR repeat protein
MGKIFDSTGPATPLLRRFTHCWLSPLVAVVLLALPAHVLCLESVALEKDPTAFFWSIQDKAQWGEVEAQFALGMIYMEGKEVQADDASAVKWFREAALQGNVQAMYQLSDMLEKGQGVEADAEEALMWRKKADETGVGEFDSNQYYASLAEIEKAKSQQDFELKMQKERLDHDEKMRKQEQRHREKMYRQYRNNSHRYR